MTDLVDYLAWEAMMMWMNLIADCPVVCHSIFFSLKQNIGFSRDI
jgi:hypothetical protein